MTMGSTQATLSACVCVCVVTTNEYAQHSNSNETEAKSSIGYSFICIRKYSICRLVHHTAQEESRRILPKRKQRGRFVDAFNVGLKTFAFFFGFSFCVFSFFFNSLTVCLFLLGFRLCICVSERLG